MVNGPIAFDLDKGFVGSRMSRKVSLTSTVDGSAVTHLVDLDEIR